MRRRLSRIGAALATSAAVIIGLGAVAAPASAQASGLTFYSGQFTDTVAHFPAPSGDCSALPAAADSHIGWSGFQDVVFYRTSDCTGQATAVGTLRTYEAGRWLTFRAF
ncbi:hypothetical protein Vqi01_15160 [Micromonospora qiuiae]|uniref:Secreted protein n=1 Tax=Micromonospora qiuiae TaxID=502268 RepID=A0ABQ4J862_9ACTN|nr:hypothetical protein [Micromonospora qiuiae]GIJ26354.1 hypothetical protein Vqi01_15160 [Micromonospora qiuiae]